MSENAATIEQWDKGVEFIRHLIDTLSTEAQSRLEYAAGVAYMAWQNGSSDSEVPHGWVGGQVRNTMPGWLDHTLDRSPLLIDATGQVAEIYYDYAKEGYGL